MAAPGSYSFPPHCNALVVAAERGNLDDLRRALDNHAGGIDDTSQHGSDTVLRLCCLFGYFPCVKFLLLRGANFMFRNHQGTTPLHAACAGGFTEIVQYMLNFVRNRATLFLMLNASDVYGNTPLHRAAIGRHLGVVRLLLEAGASPTITNNHGWIPAKVGRSNPEIYSILTAAAGIEDGAHSTDEEF